MRRILLAILATLCALAAFSVEKGELSRFSSVSLSHNYKRGIERDLTACAVEGGAKGEKWGAFLGLMSNDMLFDVTLFGEWRAFRQDLDRFSLFYGLDAVYHYQKFRYGGEVISRENDFLADICFFLRTKNDFEFSLRTGYGAKVSALSALKETIVDFTPCVVVGFSKSIGQFDAIFSAGTHTEYRYPLFCSPDYSLELAYTTAGGFRPALKGDFRINDQFTTAPYINRIALTAKLSVLF